MAKEEKILYLFEGFCLDGVSRCLWYGENTISLTPKAIDTLFVLVQNSGVVVEKNSLLEEVWANSYVEEATLAQNISTLRKTLGFYSDKLFIETAPRRGYRFIAEVETVTPDEQVVTIERNWTMIAREKVRLSDPENNVKNAADGQKPDLPRSVILATVKAIYRKERDVIIKHKFLAAGIFAFIVLAVLVVVRLGFNSTHFDSKFTKIRFTKLTSSGNIAHSAVSPDGRYLAMVEQHGGDSSLNVRQIASDNNIEIVPSSPSSFFGLTFSQDSQNIYYGLYPQAIQKQGKPPIGVLYKISLLGGIPEEVIANINSPIAISPNNDKFVFLRHSYEENRSMLIIANFSDKFERLLAARPLNKAFSFSGPAWSPDGKTISCPVHSSTDAGDLMELMTINVETGEQKSLVLQQFRWIGRNAWLKDGSGIIFPAFFSDSKKLMDEIWISSFPEGKLRQVTNGTTSFRGMSLTANSNSFVTTKSTMNSKFWVQEIKPAIREPRLISYGGFSEISFVQQGIVWAPDGKIIFGSTKNNDSDIWMMNPDGTGQKQITTNSAADYSPELSPDGNFMFFLSNRSGISNLWRMNLSNSEVKQITNLPVNVFPGFSANEKYVYYARRVDEDFFSSLWRIPADSGEAVRLTDRATLYPSISPDGALIACFYDDQNADYGTKLSILSAENGALVTLFNVSLEGPPSNIYWSRDGKSIFFLKNRNDVSTIFEQRLVADSPLKLVESKTDVIFRFALSGDGSSIVYQSGIFIQDVVSAESVKE